MKKKLIGFGELLLRLDAPGHTRFSQLDGFQAKFTGGEANVLVAANRFGIESCLMVSSVANNALGDACIEFLNRYGVDSDFVYRVDGRLGILFVETGASVRPTRVVYDREFTGFRQASPATYDWNAILKDAGILHISGTAPALGVEVSKAIKNAISAAHQAGCLVSFDCSYRSALWSIEEASKSYQSLAEKVDILFASPGDARLFFGIKSDDDEDCIRGLAEQFGPKTIAFTDRVEASASQNELTGCLLANDQFFRSKSYRFEIVDRIGSGDAFAGGILSSIMKSKSNSETVEFATAAAVLKHTIPGDFCLAASSEVVDLMNGESLRVRR